MNEKEILNFKNSIANLSLNELEAKENEVKKKISRMMFDPNLIAQAAIIESLIQEKKATK